MNKKSIRTLSSLALAVAAASSGAYGAQPGRNYRNSTETC